MIGVKALIVRLESPGGTSFGGEALYKAVRRVAAEKPTVSEVRTLAASAAYMVACGTDHIVAGDTSIVGSIGVIFQYAQVSELLNKIGVSVEEIKSAPLKSEPSPFHAASDEAKAMIQSMISDSYGWFVDLVSECRGLSRTETLKLADGSIFTGRQAVSNGLVDEIGGEQEIRVFLEDKVRRQIDQYRRVGASPVSGRAFLWRCNDSTAYGIWESGISFL